MRRLLCVVFPLVVLMSVSGAQAQSGLSLEEPWIQPYAPPSPSGEHARPRTPRYLDALAGTWAGFFGGQLGGGVLGLAVGALPCLRDGGLACTLGIVLGGLGGLSLGWALGTPGGLAAGSGVDFGEGLAAFGLATLTAASVEIPLWMAVFAVLGNAWLGLPLAGVVSAVTINFIAPLYAVWLFDDRPPPSVHARVQPTRGGAVMGLGGAF